MQSEKIAEYKWWLIETQLAFPRRENTQVLTLNEVLGLHLLNCPFLEFYCYGIKLKTGSAAPNADSSLPFPWW